MSDHTGLVRILELEAENARLNQQVEDLKKLAFIDALTGLHNQRAFRERLNEEVARLMPPEKANYKVRQGGREPLSLVMFDLDLFKGINDRYGHEGGDEVLRRVGEAVRQFARVSDFTARVGGEEFALLLPATSMGEAKALSERLRCRIEGLTIHFKGKAIPVTASFGVAEWSLLDDVGGLYGHADVMLYKAKNAGRNCVRPE